MLCILTNGFTWHGLIVDLRKPITIISHHRVITSDENGYKEWGKVCEMITNYIISE